MKYYFLIFCTIIPLFTSCTKEGPSTTYTCFVIDQTQYKIHGCKNTSQNHDEVINVTMKKLQEYLNNNNYSKPSYVNYVDRCVTPIIDAGPDTMYKIRITSCN